MSDFDRIALETTIVDRRKTNREPWDGLVLAPFKPEGQDLNAQAARIKSRLMAMGRL